MDLSKELICSLAVNVDRTKMQERLRRANEEREMIIEQFPISEWENLPIKRYLLGQPDDSKFKYYNYCYLLEFQTNNIAGMGGGASTKHVLYYSKKNEEVWKPKRLKQYSTEHAWELVRRDFTKLFDLAKENRFEEIDNLEYISPANGLVIKTLTTYFPKEILAFTSLQMTTNLLIRLGEGDYVKRHKGRIVTLNRKILEIMKSTRCFEEWSTPEIGDFVWFNLMEETSEVVSNQSNSLSNFMMKSELKLDLGPFYVDHPILREMIKALERKKQVIFFGPPGTGKTFFARKYIIWWLYYNSENQPNRDEMSKILIDETKLSDIEETMKDNNQLISITFHPSFSYEDFIEGLRPLKNDDGKIDLIVKNGLFKDFCQRAKKDKKPHILFIDEINRGNIPKIFGELITLLEHDKRGMKVTLPLSQDQFSIPENMYIVATMNTSDRSLRTFDFALRRRFAFVEIPPDPSFLSEAYVENKLKLSDLLRTINERIIEHLDRDKQIGHSYFLDSKGIPVTEKEEFAERLVQDVLPLLEEYCHRNYSLLETLIGEELVDSHRQRLNEDIITDPDAIIESLVNYVSR